MPEVATYDAGGTQRRAAITGERFRPATEDGAAAINRGAQDLAAGVQQVVKVELEIQDMEDEAAVKELAVRRNALTTRLMYGDGTPENPGFLFQTGGDAARAEEAVRRALADSDAELLGEAGSGQRQRMMSDFLAADNARHDGLISRHRATQTHAYRVTTTTALVASNVDKAAMAFATGNQEDGRVAREAGWQAELQLADMNGEELSPEMMTQRRLAYTTNIHAKTVQLLRTQGRFDEAQTYYQANIGEINAQAQIELGPTVNAEGDIAQGRMDGVRAFGAAKGDRAAAYAMLDPNWSPRRQDAFRSEVDRRFSEGEAAVKDRREANLASLTDLVSKGADVRTLDTTGLSASQINSLQALQNSRSTLDPAAGRASYNRARIMAIENPQAFLNATGGDNMMTLAATMSAGDWDRVVNVRAKLVEAQRRGVDLEPTPADRAFKTGMSRAAPWLNSNRIVNSGKTQARYGGFQAALMEEIDNIAAQNNGQITDAQIDQAVNTASQRAPGMPQGATMPRPQVARDQASRTLAEIKLLQEVKARDYPNATPADVARWRSRYTATDGKRSVPYAEIPKVDRDAIYRMWVARNPGKVPTQFQIEEEYTNIILQRGQ